MNLARGLEVLRAFSATEPVLSNRVISKLTGLPKATVSRLTYTLETFGYLRQDETGTYRLGTAVLSLAHPVLGGMQLRQIARPILQNLASTTGCTVNLGTQERLTAIYVDTIRSDVANPYLPDVGSVSPLLQSAIGRALILAQSSGQRAKLLNRIKLGDPDIYTLGMEYLEADEELFLHRGFCRARGSWLADIDAIATFIPLPKSADISAINCTISLKSMRRVNLDAIAPRMCAAAREISNQYLEIISNRLNGDN